jgi:hypothetical protein
MRRRMHSRIATLIVCILVLLLSDLRAQQTQKAGSLTVHGRLTYYNGNPSCRIWIVGTKRLLGVRESSDEMSDMPKELRRMMSWDREIFADFAVETLTPYKQGVMQMVRIVAAYKIVVTENDKVVLRKEKL